MNADKNKKNKKSALICVQIKVKYHRESEAKRFHYQQSLRGERMWKNHKDIDHHLPFSLGYHLLFWF
jgi:hypothetical protein